MHTLKHRVFCEPSQVAAGHAPVCDTGDEGAPVTSDPHDRSVFNIHDGDSSSPNNLTGHGKTGSRTSTVDGEFGTELRE